MIMGGRRSGRTTLARDLACRLRSRVVGIWGHAKTREARNELRQFVCRTHDYDQWSLPPVGGFMAGGLLVVNDYITEQPPNDATTILQPEFVREPLPNRASFLFLLSGLDWQTRNQVWARLKGGDFYQFDLLYSRITANFGCLVVGNHGRMYSHTAILGPSRILHEECTNPVLCDPDVPELLRLLPLPSVLAAVVLALLHAHPCCSGQFTWCD